MDHKYRETRVAALKQIEEAVFALEGIKAHILYEFSAFSISDEIKRKIENTTIKIRKVRELLVEIRAAI